MVTRDELMLVEDRTRPIVTMSVNLRGGQLSDPPGKEGLAYLTAHMLMRGTTRRSQAQLSEDLDTLGSNLGIAVNRDTTSVTGDALTRNLPEFEALIAEVLSSPTFPEEELERIKRQTIAEIRQVRDNDGALAKRYFVRTFYGDHVYGRPLRGTEESLARITRDDLVAFYEANYTGTGAISGACGDLDLDRFAGYVETITAGLPASSHTPVKVEVPMDWQEGYRLQLVDKPDRSQTQIYIGHPTLDANHPDYIALYMAHTIFGGTFTARLSQEIREKRGWSYGAYSYLHGDKHMGTFVLRFYPASENAIPALEVADDLFRDFYAKGPTAEELETARRFVVNSHPMSLETAEKRLHEKLTCRLLGRPDDWVHQLIPAIKALTLSDLNDAIRAHLDPNNVLTTVVCTAAPLADQITAWGRPSTTDIIDYETL